MEIDENKFVKLLFFKLIYVTVNHVGFNYLKDELTVGTHPLRLLELLSPESGRVELLQVLELVRNSAC